MAQAVDVIEYCGVLCIVDETEASDRWMEACIASRYSPKQSPLKMLHARRNFQGPPVVAGDDVRGRKDQKPRDEHVALEAGVAGGSHWPLSIRAIRGHFDWPLLSKYDACKSSLESHDAHGAVPHTYSCHHVQSSRPAPFSTTPSSFR